MRVCAIGRGRLPSPKGALSSQPRPLAGVCSAQPRGSGDTQAAGLRHDESGPLGRGIVVTSQTGVRYERLNIRHPKGTAMSAQVYDLAELSFDRAASPKGASAS